MTVLPYKDDKSGKKQQVATMFDNISHRYDFLNHFLSLGIDKYWRRRAISMLRPYQPKLILDVATGTGDFAIEALAVQPDKIIGVDISKGMLEVGRKKIAQKNLSNKIELRDGDSEKLPFENNFFDASIVAYGVRNFENLEKGLADMYRVIKPGGVVLILEFSKPKQFPIKQGFNFYFKHILPSIGKMVSKDSSAYTYLPESVQEFPDGDKFLAILEKVGFKSTKCITLAFGISSIYFGKKD
jgi:demethylmenaquinone methyltransferase / 2-methoxy-6-polyprenyl-1,4-benzoquinol methylase